MLRRHCFPNARAQRLMEMPTRLDHGMFSVFQNCCGCKSPSVIEPPCSRETHGTERSQLPGHGVCGPGDFTGVSLPPPQAEALKAFDPMQSELCVFGKGVLGVFWVFFF